MADLKIGLNVSLSNDGTLTMDINGLHLWESTDALGHLQAALFDVASHVGIFRLNKMTEAEKEAEKEALMKKVSDRFIGDDEEEMHSA